MSRYGSDPALVGNMNISPHFPAAATLWTEGWYQATGETLDGAFAADVVALGNLVTPTGQEVPLPDGGSLTGAELTDFAISGIYDKFPAAGDSPERKAYQEQVTAAAFEIVTGSPDRRALAEALGTGLTERRVLLWTADEATQALLENADVAGSLQAPDGHTLDAVAINYSASKLDAYLERRLTYEVGRCADSGRVKSRVAFALTNAIPEGADVPEYVMSQAERGPDGPINKTMAQLHLPNGAQITSVTLDGEPIVAYTFSEQGRPSVIHGMDLGPRVERALVVEFTEPADSGPGTVVPQPLAIDQVTTVVDATCEGPAGLPTPS